MTIAQRNTTQTRDMRGWVIDRTAAGSPVTTTRRRPPDDRVARYRRGLQVALGAVWLLDAGLQFQPFMFTKAFVGTLSASAAGNPAVIAQPILWAAHFMIHHIALYNAMFAVIQVAIALGLLWRPLVKAALITSLVWAVGVWWLGEGLGGILTHTASPFTGAPGGVILYAFIALLLWPRRSDGTGVLGTTGAKALWAALWAALWGSFAYFILLPANRGPQSLSSTIAGLGSGEPGWIKAIDGGLARALAGHGTEVSIAAAIACVLIGVAIFVPRAIRWAVVGAIAMGTLIWVAEDFGGIFTGQGTDPNTGLLLVLLALVYWPVSAHAARRHSPAAAASPALVARCARQHRWTSPVAVPSPRQPDRWSSPIAGSAPQPAGRTGGNPGVRVNPADRRY
jgi:hypothetical protein